MPATHDLGRLHALDALRAWMMLLGLVLHAGVSYTTVPVTTAWAYHDGQTSAFFDILIFIIHLFRMPAFFVMGGFFAALLYLRDGSTGLVVHRLRRILLPLVIAWVTIYPLIVFGFTLAQSGGGLGMVGDAIRATIAEPYRLMSLAHLWFLYHLLIFCLVAAAVAPLLQRVPEQVREQVVAVFGRLVPTWGGCLLLGVITGLTLLPMSKPALDTSITFVPALRVLAAYAVFFSFGWLLFLRRDLVAGFGRRAWLFTVVGLVMAVVYLASVLRPVSADPVTAHAAGALAGGIATWTLVYAVIGLFVRYAAYPGRVMRYAADASYWIYIVHLPVVTWFVGLLAPVAMPAGAKFLIVLVATTMVSVATYVLFVRSTVIGALLNGRRLPRGLPIVEGRSAAVST